MASDYWVRPATGADVADLERVTDEAYHDADVRLRRVGDPEPVRRTADESAGWRLRAEHLVRHDPAGCWVAEDGRGVLGVALSVRRDPTWVLASLAVRPGLHGRGIGRQLLEAALTHGAGCLRGMIAASDDPAALRRYRSAGFHLHPTASMTGVVPRAALSVVDGVREGSLGDLDLMDSVDRRVRQAAHGVDHQVLLRLHRLLVVDRARGSGYAYVRPDGSPYLLAATSRRVARDLLWECLAASDPSTPLTIGHLTAANEWAVDVGMACRLGLSSAGWLCLRQMQPPTPYVHSGQFL